LGRQRKMDKVSAIFRCHYPIMTLKNIKRRTLPFNLQLSIYLTRNVTTPYPPRYRRLEFSRGFMVFEK